MEYPERIGKLRSLLKRVSSGVDSTPKLFRRTSLRTGRTCFIVQLRRCRGFVELIIDTAAVSRSNWMNPSARPCLRPRGGTFLLAPARSRGRRVTPSRRPCDVDASRRLGQRKAGCRIRKLRFGCWKRRSAARSAWRIGEARTGTTPTCSSWRIVMVCRCLCLTPDSPP